MNVLAVVHFSTFGGPHNRTAQVAGELRNEGVDTVVAIPDEPGSAYARLRAMDIDVVQLPLHRLRRTRDPRIHAATLINARRGVDALRHVIRDRDIDVVVHNAVNAPHLALAAVREKKPLVWELIDTYPSTAVRRAFMPFVCRWSDVIMSTGAAVARAHPGSSAFGDRLILFFPCVDMDKFRPSAGATSRARRELGLPPDAPVVGTVGNINPMKGHSVFVSAAGKVCERHPDAHFVLLGASYDQYPGYLEKIESQARQLGFELGRNFLIRDPQHLVAELAPAFDVFWMTSPKNSEGIPTAIGEAMALETPVVAGAVGGIPECVRSGETGFVVAPSDPDAMVQPTLKLLEDPQLRHQMGRAGRVLAEQTFARRVGALRHLRGYQIAIAHASRRRDAAA